MIVFVRNSGRGILTIAWHFVREFAHTNKADLRRIVCQALSYWQCGAMNQQWSGIGLLLMSGTDSLYHGLIGSHQRWA